jgi:hypothetical protein
MIYNIGARNFLFLNVPPVDRSPLTSGQGAASHALEKADIEAFNNKIGDLAEQLRMLIATSISSLLIRMSSSLTFSISRVRSRRRLGTGVLQRTVTPMPSKGLFPFSKKCEADDIIVEHQLKTTSILLAVYRLTSTSGLILPILPTPCGMYLPNKLRRRWRRGQISAEWNRDCK